MQAILHEDEVSWLIATRAVQVGHPALQLAADKDFRDTLHCTHAVPMTSLSPCCFNRLSTEHDIFNISVLPASNLLVLSLQAGAGPNGGNGGAKLRVLAAKRRLAAAQTALEEARGDGSPGGSPSASDDEDTPAPSVTSPCNWLYKDLSAQAARHPPRSATRLFLRWTLGWCQRRHGVPGSRLLPVQMAVPAWWASAFGAQTHHLADASSRHHLADASSRVQTGAEPATSLRRVLAQ